MKYKQEIVITRYLVGLCIILSSSVSIAQNAMEPVSNVVARVKSPNDTSDIAYIGMRCGSLYGTIAAYFETNGNASDAQTIRDLRRQASSFQTVAIALNTKVNRMSKDELLKQGSVLANHYGTFMSDGKRLNNNAFTPFIQADLAACKIESDGYSQIAEKINSQR